MKPPVPENESKRLDALRRYRILDTDAEAVFDDLATLASTICQVPIAIMSLVDEERQWFKASVGIGVTETPREHAFCAHTIQGQELMVVEDAAADGRFADNPLVTSEPHIRFYAGAPLVDRDGHALGALCVIDQKARQLTAEQRASLKTLAHAVMAHLELRRVSADLASALTDLKTVRGLLPICCYCKGIRNDRGYWQRVEDYLSAQSRADLSHGICPDCLKRHYPDIHREMEANPQGTGGAPPQATDWERDP